MQYLDSSNVEYRLTNESLEAIVAGLNPQHTDKILAIGGSGDQALALAEFADSVIVADINPAQIELIKHRIAAIKSGDIDEVFNFEWNRENPQNVFSRNGYFRRKRLENIRNKIEVIEVLEPIDIIKASSAYPAESLDSVYMSNALASGWATKSAKAYRTEYDMLLSLSKSLKTRGLVYTASTLNQCPTQIFNINSDLTEKARKAEIESKNPMLWRPSVYQKLID